MRNKILNSLKSQDFRITLARKKMVDFFCEAKQPLTATQLVVLFKKEKFKVHRATIYREIEFLVEHDVLHSLNLGQEASSYELNTPHHHHFVCTNCGNTIDITPHKVEEELKKFQRSLAKKEKVHINQHSLKIFGLCAKCKKSTN